MVFPKSLEYSKTVQVGCFKWLTAWRFSTCTVRHTSGLILKSGFTAVKLRSSFASPFSTISSDVAVLVEMVPSGPLVTRLFDVHDNISANLDSRTSTLEDHASR